MTTRELLLSAWDLGPVVPVLCFAVLAAYAVRVRGKLELRAGYFVLAVALCFIALASPIGVLAQGYLFSAHMLQHLLLVLAVPPLLLMGMPRELDKEGDEASTAERRGPSLLRSPLVPWLAGVGAMWIWHAKTLCNAAAVSPTVQAIQTGSLLVMGLMFWRPILAPRESDRMPPLDGMLYLFAACVACTVLGVVVTLSPVEICNAYMHPVDRLGALPLLREGWGMTRLHDQELGGVMMWVPACFVYAGAILGCLARYYGEERTLAVRGGVE